jgi:hypothetical protein
VINRQIVGNLLSALWIEADTGPALKAYELKARPEGNAIIGFWLIPAVVGVVTNNL